MYKGYTISEVACKAGVSIATVSRVLNGASNVSQDARNRVLASVKEFEEVHRDILPIPSRTRSKMILASFPELRNPFYSNIIKGISDICDNYGYKVMFYQLTNYESPESYSFLKETDLFDGMIIAHAVPDYTILQEINTHTPVVMCAEHNEYDSLPFVAIDDYRSACNAINYLICNGRRKIALINSSLRNNYAIHREKAFLDCLKTNNIPVNQDWIIHLSDINYVLGITAANSLLSSESRPDAVFCISDVFAAATINVATKLGISIPRDLSVVGFDNIDISTMTIPTITTVSQPTYQIGAQACKILLEQIEYPSRERQHVILDTELILRDST